jgi:hypothetical protein
LPRHLADRRPRRQLRLHVLEDPHDLFRPMTPFHRKLLPRPSRSARQSKILRNGWYSFGGAGQL